MKEKIMIVEDDHMIANLIKVYMTQAGYEVITAFDGVEAQETFVTEGPCLIILDLMLPKLSGEAFCIWLREEQKSDAPVLVLSAKTQTDDKVQALNIGADGYMTKPFEPKELVAQAEAILRRSPQVCQKITSNGLTIKPRKGEVWLGETLLALTHHEFKLLLYLMEHANQVVSREQLIQEIYLDEEQEVYDRTIDAHIKKLRKKIEDAPSEPKRIITVRGMGYKFAEETH